MAGTRHLELTETVTYAEGRLDRYANALAVRDSAANRLLTPHEVSGLSARGR